MQLDAIFTLDDVDGDLEQPGDDGGGCRMSQPGSFQGFRPHGVNQLIGGATDDEAHAVGQKG